MATLYGKQGFFLESWTIINQEKGSFVEIEILLIATDYDKAIELLKQLTSGAELDASLLRPKPTEDDQTPKLRQFNFE